MAMPREQPPLHFSIATIERTTLKGLCVPYSLSPERIASLSSISTLSVVSF